MDTPQLPSPELPAAAIFDVDGTLVDVHPIRHYLHPERAYRDFDAFHRASVFCSPHDDVLDAARRFHADGIAVLVVTARRSRYRRVTEDWLEKYSVPYAALLMRADEDRRPDAEVKRDILAQIRTRFHVRHAYDDNPNVIALWESERIPVTVIPGWDDPIKLPDPGPQVPSS